MRPGTRALTVLSLFAGIGGLDLGLERAGMRVVGQVELDPFCRAVLAAHWPDVPRHPDVRTAPAWWASTGRPPVDVVAGGFPCQPVSLAGRRRGQADPRWLWPAMRDVIDAVRPAWVLGENVPGLRTRGLDFVTTDLQALGYLVETRTASACAVGAPHTRTRLFIVAHTPRVRRRAWRDEPGLPGAATGEVRGPAPGRSTWWTTEPPLDRVAYGVPRRVDRCRALGNAVVPQLAEHLGRLITTG